MSQNTFQPFDLLKISRQMLQICQKRKSNFGIIYNQQMTFSLLKIVLIVGVNFIPNFFLLVDHLRCSMVCFIARNFSHLLVSLHVDNIWWRRVFLSNIAALLLRHTILAEIAANMKAHHFPLAAGMPLRKRLQKQYVSEG